MDRYRLFKPIRALLTAQFRSFAVPIAAMLWLAVSCSKPPIQETEFIQTMNTGKNYLDQQQAEKAVQLFQRAVELEPGRADAHLNLANAYLLSGQIDKALEHAQTALSFDRNLAAAYYVAGCANLRAGRFAEALQMLQSCRDLDPDVAAVNYQLGLAHQGLDHLEDAISAFQDVIRLEPNHPAAHYALSRALMRAGREDESKKALERHNQIRAAQQSASLTPEVLERCKYTQAVVPQKIPKPDPVGVKVRFVDATATAFGAAAGNYRGPIGVLDYNHDDRNSLFVAEGTNGFRLLDNRNGVFKPVADLLPAPPDGQYTRVLVGDLNNDRFEDLVVLGEKSSLAFRFATNGAARDWTAASGLKSLGLVATDGALLDIDFTGKLDIMAVQPGGNGLRALRNLANMYYRDVTATSGIPAGLTGLVQIVIDDWNNDDLMDLIVSRNNAPPLYLQKIRGGPFFPTNLPPGKLEGTVLAIGDVNGDSRADLMAGGPDHIDLLLGGVNRFHRIQAALPGLSLLKLIDYDNDGWLDLFAAGDGLRVFRNIGDGQFKEVTENLGFGQLGNARVRHLAAADFDMDGDTDLVLDIEGRGLQLWRNDGGNANLQLKLRLLGNRSNASGIGIRLEVAAGAFRVHRTVSTLPIEIGVGNNRRLDSLTARWFDLAYNQIDITPDPKSSMPVFEPVLPAGSCPYVYAWDGEKFRFVSDFLGSSPVGLRVTDTVFADADPHEYLWLGSDDIFKPRGKSYVIQVTEELREVLYLDEAKLVVVDHPKDTEVHTTDKFRPSKPFPRGELWTVQNRYPLRRARTFEGADVTDALAENDGRVVSPTRLRIPQLRGLAEPHGVELDFGSLPVDRPLVLVLTGWLRFGGGMANVAASHDPDLPFPFPQLEVEVPPTGWQKLDVVVGAPSGKTKTILVDLANRLPPGATRLRLSTAFEIHWDRIALFERRFADDTRISRLAPHSTDLHWRGFSEFADLPWYVPLTPVYDRVFQQPHWAITPMGWCTRYGEVAPLIEAEDNAVAILNGGDELTLEFDADRLPPKPAGYTRDFFLYSVGWDKDADFHVELGWKVDPIPWHGMNDQTYGQEPRPSFPSDSLMNRYTTRWVGQLTLNRKSQRNDGRGAPSPVSR